VEVEDARVCFFWGTIPVGAALMISFGKGLRGWGAVARKSAFR